MRRATKEITWNHLNPTKSYEFHKVLREAELWHWQTCKQMRLQALDAKNKAGNNLKSLESYESSEFFKIPGSLSLRVSQTCKRMCLRPHDAKNNKGHNMKSFESWNSIKRVILNLLKYWWNRDQQKILAARNSFKSFNLKMQASVIQTVIMWCNLV